MAEDKEKKKVNVHIIHSMKGGCGKSTCALFKVIQTAVKQGIDDNKAHVLFIDADFKGSAMTEILFNRGNKKDNDTDYSDRESKAKQNEVNKLSEIKKDIKESLSGAKAEKGDGQHHILAIPDNFDYYITLSDYLIDSPKYSIMDIICHSCSYETESKEADVGKDSEEDEASGVKQKYYINGYIDFILSSTSSESKDRFRYMEGKIPAGVYRWRMDTVIRNILKVGYINDEGVGTYTDIVIDMPPGYDEYSDILLELLRDIAKEEKNVNLHYYAVTTEDIGHNVLAKDNVEKMIKADDKHEPFASVNLILSAVSSTDFVSLVDKERAVYRSWLDADGKSNGKVYENKYSESFHIFCRKGNIGEFEQDISKVLEEI